MKIDSGYKYRDSEISFMYEVTSTGYNIYIGDVDCPTYAQYEPFIPDHSKTYEENAIADCKRYSEETKDVTKELPIEERITTIESNVDYLMLLTDADSATEEETE